MQTVLNYKMYSISNIWTYSSIVANQQPVYTDRIVCTLYFQLTGWVDEGTELGTKEGFIVRLPLGLLDGTELGLDDNFELELELELEIDEKDDDRVLEGDEVGLGLGVDDSSNDDGILVVGNIIGTILGSRLGSELGVEEVGTRLGKKLE